MVENLLNLGFAQIVIPKKGRPEPRIFLKGMKRKLLPVSDELTDRDTPQAGKRIKKGVFPEIRPYLLQLYR